MPQNQDFLSGYRLRTHCGIDFDLENPQPEQVYPFDIAVALSRECRFAGHTKRFYSVAEHSVWCAQYAEQYYPDHAYLPFLCLIHDAHEAYMRDVPTPIIQVMGDQYAAKWAELKDRIQNAIDIRFGVRNSHRHELVKKIDRAALEYEFKNRVCKWSGFMPLGEKAACDLFIHHFVKLCKVPLILQP